MFYKMKLILHQVLFDKLLPVLSDVKLENPEFKSQNPKNSEKNPRKSGKNSEKILEKCKNRHKILKNPESIGKNPEKSRKTFRIRKIWQHWLLPPPKFLERRIL